MRSDGTTFRKIKRLLTSGRHARDMSGRVSARMDWRDRLVTAARANVIVLVAALMVVIVVIYGKSR